MAGADDDFKRLYLAESRDPLEILIAPHHGEVFGAIYDLWVTYTGAMRYLEETIK